MEKKKNFKIASTKILTKYGWVYFYDFKFEQEEIIVLLNRKKIKSPVHLRLHSACFTSEIFGSLKCDCKTQLKKFLEFFNFNKKDTFMLIYFLNHEGRGIGFFEKLKAYEVQRVLNLDTYEANLYLGHKEDLRDFSKAFDILNYFKIRDVILYTNNPRKIELFRKYNQIRNEKLKIKRAALLAFQPSKDCINYLKTKSLKGSHLFSIEDIMKNI